MAQHVKVEVVCKDEDKVVAEIETGGALTAQAIKGGLVVKDRVRWPGGKAVVDGDLLRCLRCQGVLYFRGQDGELVRATPGTMKAQA